MRILVFGVSGMLGHKLCQILSDSLEVWATAQRDPTEYYSYGILPKERIVGHVVADDLKSVLKALEQVHPDAVVNALGIVKQRDEAKQAISSIQVNALFPHHLAELCAGRGIRVIQVSTDCVFSGFRGNYSESDVPDPVDLYGRTKLLGELNRPGCLTLRTSIIGWQLNTFSGLLSWFALQRGKHIKGYRKAIYTGLTTSVMANLIGDILQTRPDLNGLYQVSSEPISKYDLLTRLRDIMDWKDIVIEPDDQFFCDRSLIGTRFTAATGWRPPAWETMLQGLAKVWPRYANFYSQYSGLKTEHVQS